MNEEKKLPSFPDGYYSTGEPEEDLDTVPPLARKEEIYSGKPRIEEASLSERIECLFGEIKHNIISSDELTEKLEAAKIKYETLREKLLKKEKVNGEMTETLKIIADTSYKAGYNEREYWLLIGRMLEKLSEMLDKIESEK
jgi:hypothetical protein